QQWWKATVIPRSAEPRQMVVLLHEITQKVSARLDEAIYKSRLLAEERAYILESLIQSIADPVVLVNPLGQVVGLNREAADFLGVEAGIFVNCNLDYAALALRSHPKGQVMERSELPVQRALRGEVVRGVEVVVESRNRPENKAIFNISASPVRDSKGNIIMAVSVAKDISERVGFERAKDGFISVASHELRTPLGIVRGLAQLMEIGLRRKAEMAPHLRQVLEELAQQQRLSRELRIVIDEFLDQEKELKHCAAIINRVDQMARLISEVLDAYRLETGRVEIDNRTFNLLATVREVAERLQITTQRHRLEVEADGEHYLVFGDRDRIDQVVTNLVSNAIKYSPDGGVVRVRLRHLVDEIEVAVTDPGVGIAEKDQKFIFERFYRAENAMPETGLGLGLYISRQIVLEHGGRMWVESQPGKGSTFFFSLPSDEAF
ncbi:MAG: ATP-binding protein, partial [Syntrophomonadaceae bacterium]|nr:ATP-binding protein [Syntrophomonadaceae bacterium]